MSDALIFEVEAMLFYEMSFDNRAWKDMEI